MSENQITVNTRPVADQYGSEKIIEFSSPVGGGLISFLITPDDQLSVHVARQDMTVRVTAGEAGTPVRHGNLRADAALYQAARAFVTDWEAAHPDQDAEAVSRLTALARDLGVSEPDLDDTCTTWPATRPATSTTAAWPIRSGTWPPRQARPRPSG